MSNTLEITETGTPNGFDRHWVEAINQVFRDREINIVITDLHPTLWDNYISPMADAIEESVKNIGEEIPLVILDSVSCAKCGTTVPPEKIIVDEGEGKEAGNLFYYCSEDCRDRH